MAGRAEQPARRYGQLRPVRELLVQGTGNGTAMQHGAWPARMSIVRHGQSAGNVASELAERRGHAMVDIAVRDMDVPLSELGERQASALGRWLSEQSPDELPTVMLTSPYVRTMETGRLLLGAAGLPDIPVVIDERLREREYGILDRFTMHGVNHRFPEQAELRARLGKFYHRPPGGESWCDVLLRLRSVMQTIRRDFADERVLIVTHRVVVYMFRYLLENMTEQEIMAIDREHDVANCSLTTYSFPPEGVPVLDRFNFVVPIEESGTPVTSDKDRPIAARG